jgi:hypothetical protein
MPIAIARKRARAAVGYEILDMWVAFRWRRPEDTGECDDGGRGDFAAA